MGVPCAGKDPEAAAETLSRFPVLWRVADAVTPRELILRTAVRFNAGSCLGSRLHETVSTLIVATFLAVPAEKGGGAEATEVTIPWPLHAGAKSYQLLQRG